MYIMHTVSYCADALSSITGPSQEQERAQVKLENEQDKLRKQQKKQEMRAVLQKALEERIAFIQQEYREQQDLDEKLIHRALQDLQQEAEKKQQKKVRRLSGAHLQSWVGSMTIPH